MSSQNTKIVYFSEKNTIFLKSEQNVISLLDHVATIATVGSRREIFISRRKSDMEGAVDLATAR